MVRSSQRGFTLVEMSIVLVIIGLIIGGILKGQEIINNARQKAIAADVDGLRAATNTFVDRYAAFPGDFLTASATRLSDLGAPVGGNQNGVIDTTLVGNANFGVAVNATEKLAFMCHLGLVGLLDSVNADATNCTGTPTVTTCGGASALPAAPSASGCYGVISGTTTGVSSTGLRTAHWVQLGRTPNAAPVGAISSQALGSLDGRFDDSNSALGSIQSNFAGGCPAAGYTGSTDNNCIAYFELAQ